MSKRRPTARKKRPRLVIPPQLAGLAALLHSETGANSACASGLARALDAARSALRDPLTNDPGSAFWAFVNAEAKRGAWRDLHAAIDSMNEHDERRFDALGKTKWTTGDFQNVYAGPALTFALALCHVYYIEGGAR